MSYNNDSIGQQDRFNNTDNTDSFGQGQQDRVGQSSLSTSLHHAELVERTGETDPNFRGGQQGQGQQGRFDNSGTNRTGQFQDQGYNSANTQSYGTDSYGGGGQSLPPSYGGGDANYAGSTGMGT